MANETFIAAMDALAGHCLTFGVTYLVHSTLLLTIALLAGRTVFRRTPALDDAVLRSALVGGLATALLSMLASSPVAVSAPATVDAFLAGLSRPRDGSTTLRSTPRDDLTIHDGVPRSSADPNPSTLSALEHANATGTPPSAPARSTTASPSHEPSTLLPWRSWALATWILVAAFGVFRLLAGWLALQRELGKRRPIVAGLLPECATRLRECLGLRRPVRITWSETLETPVALGRCEVCVPLDALQRIDDGQQLSMLAHELGHLRRADPTWRVVCAVLEATLFFQPLNRLARRRLHRIAEYLADDWAVTATGSGVPLASCLVEVASWGASEALPSQRVPMAQTGDQLVYRIERLLSMGAPSRPPEWLRRVCALAPLAAVGLLAPSLRSPLSASSATLGDPLIPLRWSLERSPDEIWTFERLLDTSPRMLRNGRPVPSASTLSRGTSLVALDDSGRARAVVHAPTNGGLVLDLALTPLTDRDREGLQIHEDGPSGRSTWRLTRAISGAWQLDGSRAANPREHEGEWELSGPAGRLPLVVRTRAPSSSADHAPLGFTVAPTSRALAAQLGVEPLAALVVQTVEEGSPAEQSGLEPYDVLTGWNGRVPELRRLVDEVTPVVLLEVHRRGTRRSLLLLSSVQDPRP